MDIKTLPKAVGAYVISIAILFLSRIDNGLGGLILFLSVFTFFIFLELYFLRGTLLELYAEAITEHRVLGLIIRGRVINAMLTLIISLYLSFNLVIFVNLASPFDLTVILVSGLFLSLVVFPVREASKHYVKDRAAQMFSRVGAIFFVVVFAVLLDGALTTFLPIDTRITEPFDIEIPLYVIDDVEHSYLYFQHLLRSFLFLEYNVQSIALSEDVGAWFHVIRYILGLTPTPYIAYTILLLSFRAVNRIVVERNLNE